MITDNLLHEHIKTIDHLLITDIWTFLQHKEEAQIEVEELPEE
jgi:hypothetical protein